MSVTPEGNKQSPQSSEDVQRSIEMQINRDIDSMRARHYWGKTLEETPKEVLVEALSMALANGRYQKTPRCQCYCHHRH
ncbi:MULTISPECIES: hypothetical protein [Pseudomonas]|jgi:hypothetical protein|uniref:hypothetical protein n=1 Tax=Pseudomonas TaxID=286 RepID=UPI0012DA6AD5|nr:MULTISPECIES: hypothetical protein [Pseudomonas]MBA1297788.1 hypothetical protein [Pseudomonas carnis]MDH0796237.1 hypothetical protein [Pseudomonas carnis]QHA99118.1 hypothetical protein FXO12_21095 [Pseudomonas sp. J380]